MKAKIKQIIKKEYPESKTVKVSQRKLMKRFFILSVAVLSLVATLTYMSFTPSPTYAENNNDNTNSAATITNTNDNTNSNESTTNSNTNNNTNTNTTANTNTTNDNNNSNTNTTTDTQTGAWSVNGKAYSTLKDAYDNSKSGDTIMLTEDHDMTQAGVVSPSNRIIDLNGHTLSSTGFTFVIEGTNITIQNGTTSGNSTTYGLFIGDEETTDNVTVQNITVKGGINIFNATNVVLENVTIDDSIVTKPFYAVYIDLESTVTIKSGTFESKGKAIIFMPQKSDKYESSSLNIQGGHFEGDSDDLLLTPISGTYTPVISGGVFFSGKQAAPYLASGYALAWGSGEEATVVKTRDIQPTTILPNNNNLEYITTMLSPGQLTDVSNALTYGTVQTAIKGMTAKGSPYVINVELVDKLTHIEQHPAVATFILPYPSLMDATNWKNYEFSVVHLKMTGIESESVMTPEVLDSNEVTPTAQGLQITVSSLSPFIITYKAVTPPDTTPQNPPSQNDNTNTTVPDNPNDNQPTNTNTNTIDDNDNDNATNTNNNSNQPNVIPASTSNTNSNTNNNVSSYGKTESSHIANTNDTTPIVILISIAVFAAAIATLVAVYENKKNEK